MTNLSQIFPIQEGKKIGQSFYGQSALKKSRETEVKKHPIVLAYKININISLLINFA